MNTQRKTYKFLIEREKTLKKDAFLILNLQSPKEIKVKRFHFWIVGNAFQKSIKVKGFIGMQKKKNKGEGYKNWIFLLFLSFFFQSSKIFLNNSK